MDRDKEIKAEVLGKVRLAAGEASDRLDLKAERELEKAKADGEAARTRTAHAGNRKHPN